MATGKEKLSVRREVMRRILDLSIAALGLVAALAWNEAITALVKEFIPQGSTIVSLFVYAILVTLLAVLVTLQVSALANKLKTDEKDAQEKQN